MSYLCIYSIIFFHCNCFFLSLRSRGIKGNVNIIYYCYYYEIYLKNMTNNRKIISFSCFFNFKPGSFQQVSIMCAWICAQINTVCCQGPSMLPLSFFFFFFSLQLSPPLRLSLFPSRPCSHSFRSLQPPPSAGAGDHRQRRSDGRAASASISLTAGRRETGKRGGGIKLVGETRERVGAVWVAAGRPASFPPSSFWLWALSGSPFLPPPLRLLRSFFSPRLSSQLPPWGLSSPSPSPPPWLPTSPGRCLETPGCCAAGGCLGGSLRRRLRRLHSCWGVRGATARTVRSARSRCPTRSGRSSRTRGGTSTKTVRMWGFLCSSGKKSLHLL